MDTLIEKIADEITGVLKNHNIQNIELEFRLGHVETDKFQSNINDTFFKTINRILGSSSVFKNTKHKYIDNYFTINNKRIRHRVYDNNEELYIMKNKLINIDVSCSNGPFDFRISLSTEESVDKSMIDELKNGGDLEDHDDHILKTYERKNERNSYIYKCWSWDLTVTSSGSTKNNEIEIEVIDIKSQLAKNDMKYIVESGILKIQDMMKMCEKTDEELQYEISNIKKYRI